MTNIRRICLALVLFSAVIFVPSRGWCVLVDPYSFTTIKGSVFFEFSRDTRTEKDTTVKDTTSSFNQDYGLSLSGNIFSRLLVIYDGSIDYSRQSFFNDVNKNTGNNLSFDISTTLIPKSNIPLTLFGSRSTSWSSTDADNVSLSRPVNTLMGLNWAGKFVVLPVMSLSIRRQVTSSGEGEGSSKSLDIIYYADKDFGPTKNHFQYQSEIDSPEGGDSSTGSSFSFDNSTQLSRHSTFRLGVVRDSSFSNVESSERVKTLSLIMGLDSSPSRFFNQSHSISHSRTDIEGGGDHSNSTAYSGGLSYQVSRKLNLNLSLGVFKGFTETDTSSIDTTNTSLSTASGYKLTEHLSITQALSANFTETSASEQSELNLSDSKSFNSTTNLNYFRDFSYFNFNTSYGLGYVWNVSGDTADIPNDNNGQAVTHNGAIGFSRIDFNRFFLFNTGGSFDDVLKTTSGNVQESHRQYYFSFDSRFWKKYLSINGDFNKGKSSDAITGIREDEETETLKFKVTPIKGGGATLDLERRVSFTSLAGEGRSQSAAASVYYGHKLFGGGFSASAAVTVSDGTFDGGGNNTRLISSSLTYTRMLFRRLTWNFKADFHDFKVDDTFSRNLLFSNRAFYRLRSWSLNLEHTYNISQTSSSDTRENRIVLRAGRQFRRIF